MEKRDNNSGRIKPNFDLEIYHLQNYNIIAGVDEAGRGPWVGPVYSAAVILDQDNIPDGINDSKKISSWKRKEIFNKITSNHVFGVGIASVEEIDKINILEATFLAMTRAINNLEITPDLVLVDGNITPETDIKTKSVVRGDSKSLSIASASIVAKVLRDQYMEEIDVEFPSFNWKRNKGYGTKEHLNALEHHGPTKYHRKSFSPVRKMLSL